MKSVSAIFFCIVLTYTCHAQIDTSTTAVIPHEEVSGLVFNNFKNSNLTPKDLIQIEKILNKCILENQSYLKGINSQESTKMPSHNIELKNYKRQYVAVLNDKGEKEVWINCFCMHWDKYWKKEIVLTKGGGSCFFNLKINLSNGKYYDLKVNSDE